MVYKSYIFCHLILSVITFLDAAKALHVLHFLCTLRNLCGPKNSLPIRMQRTLENLHLKFLQIIAIHSALIRSLTKVWKTWRGPLRGGRAWTRGPKYALSKILQNKEHYH